MQTLERRQEQYISNSSFYVQAKNNRFKNVTEKDKHILRVTQQMATQVHHKEIHLVDIDVYI